MASHQQIQIFLSYAREDYAAVRQLYDRLLAAGYKPWMDKVDLPKGADFAKAIPKVLRESDLFIVCLSPRSVEERSFIQREINLALDAWEQKLEDDLFIFPVRLEECKAPDRISKFNWTDLFGDEHEEEWNALLQALRTQAERLGKALILPSAALIENNVAKSLPKSFTENLNGVLLEMILVPAGNFLMGGNMHDHEKPQHEVTVPSFYIGKYQVTQKQWQAVMGESPSWFKGDNLPVVNISWYMAKEFCEKLSQLTSKDYRLPSEAEWEYACRAGTTDDYAGNLDELAWYNKNSGGKIHPVEGTKPNGFGLYDMHGNVWEWGEDVWHKNYKDAPQDGSAWTEGRYPNTRVVRGGSWILNDNYCRSTNRNTYDPAYRYFNFGLRVVVSARTLL